MREPIPSGSQGHQLILFYRVNGVCTELPLTCDSTGEDGVYTVKCEYVKKKKSLSKFYFQLQGIYSNVLRI